MFLSDEGRQQAADLVGRLAAYDIAHIYSSPMERALETAEPLARARGLQVEINHHFSEIDFGEWAGKTFAELDPDPVWQRFNRFRSSTCAPEGESMLAVQSRVTHEMERLRHRHDGQTLALFTHSDVVKAALLYYLGMPLDFFLRLEISPASTSVVRLGEHGVQVSKVNT